VFTAKALDSLARLRQWYEAGRIWVAPTREILDFTYMRTFVDYAARVEGTIRVIDVLRVRPPVGEAFVPSVEGLAGLSLECPKDLPVEVRLAGRPLPSEAVKVATLRDSVVVYVPLPGGPGGDGPGDAPGGGSGGPTQGR
jgi:hypothetical protein